MKKALTVIFIFIASISCAQIYLVPDLPQRILWLDRDNPGKAYFDYVECSGHFLGLCSGKKLKRDYYDLNDAPTWQKLHDMGFIMRVWEKH